MQIVKTWLRAMAIGLLMTGSVLAQERGTKEEAVAMVKAALDHMKKVGNEKALQDFTKDKANWVKKDLYVMVYNGKNVGLAHGANEKIVGRDMSEVKDVNGVPIVSGMNQIAASKGKGWLDYDWPHPQTKKVEQKTTYVEKLPSGDGFLAVGIYR
jgi:cytochrome c